MPYTASGSSLSEVRAPSSTASIDRASSAACGVAIRGCSASAARRGAGVRGAIRPVQKKKSTRADALEERASAKARRRCVYACLFDEEKGSVLALDTGTGGAATGPPTARRKVKELEKRFSWREIEIWDLAMQRSARSN